jgi:hypothetical protein
MTLWLHSVGEAAQAYTDRWMETCLFPLKDERKPFSLAASNERMQNPGCTEFICVSWNACGMEAGAILDAVALIENAAWDVIFIQEVPFADRSCLKTLEGVHILRISVSPDSRRSACILLHKRWATYPIQFQGVTSRLAYLDLDFGDLRLRLTCIHLPHALYPDVFFEAALQALEDLVASARATHRTDIVGVDANAVIGNSLETDIDTIIGDYGVGPRNRRGHMFAPWLHGQT